MRRTITMIVVVALALLVTATGVAVAQQELRDIYCQLQSPNTQGGECKGTKGRDDIDGTRFNDQIAGLGDHDTLRAYWGDDRLEGALGDDRLEGGPGKDWAIGGYDDETLYGGEGRDILRDDAPFGPKGVDPCYTPPPDTDRVYGGADDDRIDVHDGDTDDVVSCGEGRDIVRFDKFGTASDKLEGCEVRYPNPDYGNTGW